MRSLLVVLVISALLMVPADGYSNKVSWQGTSGMLRLYDAGTVGRGKLVFSMGTSYYRHGDVQLVPGLGGFYYDSGDDGPTVDYNFFISRAGLSLGLSDYVELSTTIDVRNWIMQVPDAYSDSLESVYKGGLGDTRANVKVSLPLPSDYFKMGILGSASFPTGNKDRSFTTDKMDFSVTGLFTLNMIDIDNFVPTRLHLNTGYYFNKNEEDGYGIINMNDPNTSGFGPPAYPAVPEGENDNFNDMFRLSTGVDFILKERSRIFLEFTWDNFLNYEIPEDISMSSSVYSITPGFSVASERNVELLMAMDINLNSEDNLPITNPPDWTAYFMLSYGGFVIPQDEDKDGIEDKLDKCPQQPEDVDGYQDEDGCPELDNDSDGIKDEDDECPNLAEDFDGFEDEDGCPDLDNDGDGIPDAEDRCPNEPEDFDGTEDTDGCPDIIQDTDKDGVPDDSDECPEKKEDPDGYQDNDGCPDLDNDLDGILDSEDQCPNEPETFNGYQDEDGCPDTKPIEKEFILKGIHFESGSSKLTPDSYVILDQVVKSLMAYPEVRVEIRGYTDSVGGWEFNLKLSRKRAESVREYLINSGISPDRLVAEGYGEADPVDSNETAAGRAANRRIEFHRLN